MFRLKMEGIVGWVRFGAAGCPRLLNLIATCCLLASLSRLGVRASTCIFSWRFALCTESFRDLDIFDLKQFSFLMPCLVFWMPVAAWIVKGSSIEFWPKNYPPPNLENIYGWESGAAFFGGRAAFVALSVPVMLDNPQE